MKRSMYAGIAALGMLTLLGGPALAAEPIAPMASHRIAALGAYGYDLTKLFPGGATNPNDGELVMGSVRHRVDHDGVTFLFVTAEAAEIFGEQPDRYLPGGGGYCLLGLHRRATGAPHKGDMPPPGDPAAPTFGDGRWYFHGGPGAEKIFEEDPATIDARTREAAAYFERRLGDKAGELPAADKKS